MPYTLPPPAGTTGEISADRTPKAKKFTKAGGEKVLRSHIGRVHYWDQFDLDGSGQRYREIDTTLVALGGAQGWAMADKYGDYFCSVARRSNEFSTFKNFEPANRGTDEAEYDEIGIRVPVPNPQAVVGVKTGPLAVTYPGAFNRGGVDMDLVVSCHSEAIAHEVVIPSQPTGIAAEMPLVFELDVPAGLDFEINNIDWVDRTGTERTTQAVRIGKSGTPKSEWLRLRRFKVHDDAGRSVPIDVTFEETSPGTLTMTKLIPRSFLLSATYPVTTDALISPFADNGDGAVMASNAVWATVHGATTGTSSGSAATANTQSRSDGSLYYITRSHWPFDISAIGAGGVISAIDFNVYHVNWIDQDNDSEGYWTLFESTMSDPTTLADADFDNFGSEIIDAGDRVDHTGASTGYNSHDLNAAGIAIADVEGWLQICSREGHDATNNAIGSNLNNNTQCRTSERGGTATDPYVDVTYSIAYTLTAAGGTYTETGTAAGLAYGRVVDAASGSYTETGTAAGLAYGRVVDAEAGAYTETGTAATLAYGRLPLDAEAGSYVETGTAATLTYTPAAEVLDAESGSYVETGTAATLTHDRVLSAETGTYTETGTAAGLAHGRKVSAEAGSYTETGTAAGLAHGRVLSAESGSYVETGTAATLTYSPAGATYTLTADSGSFTETGTAAGLAHGRVLGAGAGSYTETGTATTLFIGRTLTAAAGSFTWTGTAVDLDRTYAVAAEAGSYTVSGTAAGLDYTATQVAGRDTEVGYEWVLRAGQWTQVFGIKRRYTSSMYRRGRFR